MDTFRGPTLWMLLASGLAAGALAYTISSRREVNRRDVLLDRARDFRTSEAAKVGREFIADRVVPEMKPVMLDLLKDTEEYVHRYFQKAEKAIKAM